MFWLINSTSTNLPNHKNLCKDPFFLFQMFIYALLPILWIYVSHVLSRTTQWLWIIFSQHDKNSKSSLKLSLQNIGVTLNVLCNNKILFMDIPLNSKSGFCEMSFQFTFHFCLVQHWGWASDWSDKSHCLTLQHWNTLHSAPLHCSHFTLPVTPQFHIRSEWPKVSKKYSKNWSHSKKYSKK